MVTDQTKITNNNLEKLKLNFSRFMINNTAPLIHLEIPVLRPPSVKFPTPVPWGGYRYFLQSHIVLHIIVSGDRGLNFWCYPRIDQVLPHRGYGAENARIIQAFDITSPRFLSSLIGVGYSQKKIVSTTVDAS